jgi:hypothetical protein
MQMITHVGVKRGRQRLVCAGNTRFIQDARLLLQGHDADKGSQIHIKGSGKQINMPSIAKQLIKSRLRNLMRDSVPRHVTNIAHFHEI